MMVRKTGKEDRIWRNKWRRTKRENQKSIKSEFAQQILILLITGIKRWNQEEGSRTWLVCVCLCVNYRKEKGSKENGEASQVGSVSFAWVQEASCVVFAASLAQPLCYRVRGVVNAAWDLRKTVPKHTRWQFTHRVLRLPTACCVRRDNNVMFSRSVTLSSVLLFFGGLVHILGCIFVFTVLSLTKTLWLVLIGFFKSFAHTFSSFPTRWCNGSWSDHCNCIILHK